MEQKALKKPADGKKIEAEYFYDTRDYILFRLIHSSLQRPKALTSITKETINRAVIKDDGWASLTVRVFFFCLLT